jgi:hypothetical protein
MATWVAILKNHTQTGNRYVEAQESKAIEKPTYLKTKKCNLKTHHPKQPYPKKT